jgi:hypothetical protein
MANRPANAGSGRGLAPMGNTAPPLGAVAPPPPIHHDVPRGAPRPPGTVPHPSAAPPPAPSQAAAPQAAAPQAAAPQASTLRADAPRADAPRADAPRAAAPRTVAGHRAARSRESRSAGDRNDPVASGLAWVPYLMVLAGVAVGMYIVWQGSKYAGRGTALVGCSMLAAGLARLILPPRYAGLLSTRRKASDVLAFAVFGAAVLAVALMLP